MQREIKGQISRLVRRVTACMLALCMLLCGVYIPQAQAAQDGTVRVHLTRLKSPTSISLSVSCDYLLSGDVKMNIPSGSSLKISLSGGEFTAEIDGMKVYCGSSVRLLRCGGGNSGISFASPSLANVFCGDLHLSASGGAIKPILHIYVEDYLYGVVAYEMSNSYPLEALKSQAVAARNYVLKKMASRVSKDFDVTDTTSDQVFRGYNSKQDRVIQAVDETAGQVLYYGNTIASCYYGASNGGQTQSTKNAWGSSLAYSVVKDDPYDLENPSAKKNTAVLNKDASNLHASLEAAMLQGAKDALEAAGADLDTAKIIEIKAVTAMDPRFASPSRLYQTLRCDIALSAKNAAGKNISVSARVNIPTYGGVEDWYSLSLNSAKSETVTVEETDTSFNVVFRRWGHGIGMSQRGAQTMASAYGKDHAFILDFYYPGTNLSFVSLSRPGTSSHVSAEGEVLCSGEILSDTELRSSADETSSVIAKLPAGLKVSVHEADETTARVSIRGLSGYVPVTALDGLLLPTPTMEPTPEPTPTPTIEPTATPTVEPTATPTVEPTATPTVEPTATPTIEPTATPTVEPTATPTVEPTATPTVEPTATPTVEPTATPTVEPTATPTLEPTATPTIEPTTTPTPAPTSRPTAAPLPTVMDFPMATPAPGPAGSEGMLVANAALYAYVRVSAGSTLVLRSAAQTSSTPLAYLSNGERVQLLAFNDEWACVRTGQNVTGYASRSYLYLPGLDSNPIVQDTPKVTPAPGKFKGIETGITFCSIKAKTETAVQVYERNSTSSDVVGKLPASSTVTVTAYNKNWAYIKLGGKRGFVQLKYLRAE